MKILEYSDLDLSRVRKQYDKLRRSLERDDFASAEVKKVSEQGYYRAKLDDTNRVLFRIVRHNGERYALILEIIHQHAYAKSRFLRGASIDESKIPDLSPEKLSDEAVPVAPYINPNSHRFHLLDKLLSFDPTQQEIYDLTLPLIVIGPAGSGKTALTLEKMKQTQGQVLYVTLSPYLAENARNLYYGHHYENPDQEIAFLSLREYLETLQVPPGKEIRYNVFANWVQRIPRQQRVADAHQLYEEFRGVITGSAVDRPYLSRDDYLQLGVRQSIFLGEERATVYALFERYLGFLKEQHYYDPNILAHDYLPRVQPLYDFVVVDEVQDITNIQLQAILKGLKHPSQFLLCGDSNQIVHPNFFSWAGLKSMFYLATSRETREITRILQTNYRNTAEVTALANRLLSIKQRRFGSIDRESNYLMQSSATEPGVIELLVDSDATRADLNRKTRRSTRFAVLVMRDEQKPEARKYFDTPLLFSIHEAKGLEYENIVLWNFVSSERKNFQEIVQGVTAADLENTELGYARGRDKTDKSLDVYKFFINALYVAVTRAVRNLYLIESDTRHPLLQLLRIDTLSEKTSIAAQQSSLEEWQAEARRLELQGKQEQADEIRREILQNKPVPWEVLTGEQLLALMARAADPAQVSRKPKDALFDYALYYDDPGLVSWLEEHRYDRAKPLIEYRYRDYVSLDPRPYQQLRIVALKKHLASFESQHFKEILRNCDSYGVDYRSPFNRTPLMLAVQAGNRALIENLLHRGANPDLIDNYGLTAWQIGLLRAFEEDKYATGQFPAIHDLLVPSHVSLKADERLLKLDNHLGDFLLFQAFFVLLRAKINYDRSWGRGYATADFLDRLARLPDSIVPEYRKKRAYLSGILARNEVNSSVGNNRKLFVRIQRGYYLLNPRLELRMGELEREEWINVYTLANLPLMAQTGGIHGKRLIDTLQALTQGK